VVSVERLIVGTRGSLLARWQAGFVSNRLSKAFPDLQIEEKIIITEGDRISTGPLWNVGGKGLWVKEIETALLSGLIDLAVHSMKDLPGQLADGLVLVAALKRDDARDAIVCRFGLDLDGLPPSAKVGTTSLRRACQLKARRPDLNIEILRGNLDTRLRKVAEGVVDVAVLACAGMDRLGFAERITERLAIECMLPAVGQGAIAVEARADDERARVLCQILNDEQTELCVGAERSYLAHLGATCRTPVAGHARVIDGKLEVTGLVGKPDGSILLTEKLIGQITDSFKLGIEVADSLLSQGAGDILTACA
jgi:hydroxymethylbilane synthase